MLQFYIWILWCMCHGLPRNFGKSHRLLREWSYLGTRGMVLLSIISFFQVEREKKEGAASCQKRRRCSQGVTRSLLESLLFSLLMNNLKHRVYRNLICSADDPKLLRIVKIKLCESEYRTTSQPQMTWW